MQCFNVIVENILRDTILEKHLAGDVYHATSLDSITKILTNDKILLSPNIGADEIDDYDYFLSVSRVPSNSYRGRIPVLVLDGDSLSRRFKVSPIDYWSRGSDTSWRGEFGKNEAEERILTNKPFISSDYIKEIHFLKPDNTDGGNYEVYIHLINAEAKRKKIPVYLYDDVGAFNTLNKRKARLLSDEDDTYEYTDNSYNTLRSFREDGSLDEIEEIIADVKSDFRRNPRDVWQVFNGEWLTTAENVLHNLKRNRSPVAREAIKEYFRFMKTTNFKNLEELVNDFKERKRG